jgi:hypothetical protein
MARFILDVASLSEKEITEILSIVENKTYFKSKARNIVCIDESNDNQFNIQIKFNKNDGETKVWNGITEQQVKNHKQLLIENNSKKVVKIFGSYK